MSVQEVIRIPGWSGSEDLEGNDTVSVPLLVSCSSIHDGPFVVSQSPLVPTLGSVYRIGNDVIPYLFCKKRTYKHMTKVQGDNDTKQGCVYSVTCEFGRLAPFENRNAEPDTSDPFGVEMYTENVSYEFLTDIEGNQVANSAGEPFVQVPTENRETPVVVLTRRENKNPYPKISQYKNTTNSTAIFGEDEYQWLISIRASWNGKHWRTSYTFKQYPFPIGDWRDVEILDRGLNEDDGDGGLKPILENGVPVSSPKLLDGLGAKLVEGNDPEYITYPRREAKDWASLRIPDFSKKTAS